jgi:hypothetical protein
MYVPCQGCEYHGYSSDITRTWPVNGRFSQPQRDLYEAVLSVQTELIRMCATLPSLDSLFHAMCSLLGLRLQELGVLSSRTTQDELTRVSSQLSWKCGFLVISYLALNNFSAIGAYYFYSKCITVFTSLGMICDLEDACKRKWGTQKPSTSINIFKKFGYSYRKAALYVSVCIPMVKCKYISYQVWKFDLKFFSVSEHWIKCSLNKLFTILGKGTDTVCKIILCL